MKHFILFSLVGILFFFNLAGAKEISVYKKTDNTWHIYWCPDRSQFDSLVKNVGIIIAHENKFDTSNTGKTERKGYFAYLKDWQNNPYSRFNSILNAIGGNDLDFYKRLKRLVVFSDKGDLYMLQSILIAEHWPMHSAHIKNDYVPIWNMAQVEKFYALQASDTIPAPKKSEITPVIVKNDTIPQEKISPIFATENTEVNEADTSETNPWGL